MANRSVDALFKNNLRRANEVITVTLPALIREANVRTGQGAEYVATGTTYVTSNIPADVILQKVYLVVDEAMGGTVTVTNLDGTKTFFSAAAVTSAGAAVSSVVDTLVTAEDGFAITFSANQTAGQVRIVAEFLSNDTNIGIYA